MKCLNYPFSMQSFGEKIYFPSKITVSLFLLQIGTTFCIPYKWGPLISSWIISSIHEIVPYKKKNKFFIAPFLLYSSFDNEMSVP